MRSRHRRPLRKSSVELKHAAEDVGVGLAAISAIRRSVIEQGNWEAHLAYSPRTSDAAAELGCEVVSFGLHQPLTPKQREQLWFWRVEGHKDPSNDKETWGKAVTRLRELGRYAADVGVLISLEMYEDTYLGRADSSVRLVEDIGLSNVGLNPDLGNPIRLHRPLEDWRELVAKTLPFSNFWHMKSYFRRDDEVGLDYPANFAEVALDGIAPTLLRLDMAGNGRERQLDSGRSCR